MALLCAQDFKPGQQAQGMLESKNVTVDYATGTFHYHVPVYTLKSGDYELPITLDYTARGVRVDDRPGLLGYNWTLNTGGVVTRTVRGGIADENSPFGFLAKEKRSTIPLENDLGDVCRHERDGECDIFTAAFGNQTVSFIIRMDEKYCIYAEPLERTNVRIECENKPRSFAIDGWVITDENGNKYIYRQQEWTENVGVEGSVSFNSVRTNDSYVSAWHLSRIEPLNAPPIVFLYRGSVRSQIEETDIWKSIYYTENWVKFDYGKPVWEHPFDFSKYEEEFWEYMDIAMEYIDDYSNSIRCREYVKSYMDINSWLMNPFHSQNPIVEANDRVLGMLANLRDVSIVSVPMVQLLDQLHDAYSSRPESSAKMAASFFRNARNLVFESLEEIDKNVTVKETMNGTRYEISSPMLETIVCLDGMMCLEYDDYLKCLSSISLCDWKGNTIREVRPVMEGDCLKKASFFGKNNTFIKQIQFDYYTCARKADERIESDLWGYRKAFKIDNYETELYGYAVDTLWSKWMSLKTITLPRGGTIQIDYEPNQAACTPTSVYGGLRLASLVIDDGQSEMPDTVSYRYSFGTAVYDKVSNQETVSYSGFQDKATYSRMKFEGAAFLKTGNNGVYYPYVQEKCNKKGAKAYWFYVPYRDPYSTQGQVPFKFWLYGLPLGQALYNEQGQLLELTKNVYYNDYLYSTDYDTFEVLPDSFLFTDGVMSEGNNDLSKVNGEKPYKRIEYAYGNLAHSLNPTSITVTDSKGTRHTEVVKRVCDMGDNAAPEFREMKKLNVLQPVVKRYILVNDTLLEARVHTYEVLTQDTLAFVVPEKEYLHLPKEKLTYRPTSMESALFDFEEENYDLDKSYTHATRAGLCTVTGYRSYGEACAVNHDLFGSRIEFQTKAADGNEAFGKDGGGKYALFYETLYEIKVQKRYSDMARAFFNAISGQKVSFLPSEYIEYLRTNVEAQHVMNVLLFMADKEKQYGLSKCQFALSLDSVRTHRQYLENFYEQTRQVLSSMPDSGFQPINLQELLFAGITNKNVLGERFLLYRNLYDWLPYADTPVFKAVISSFPDNGRLCVYALNMEVPASYNGTVATNQGVVRADINWPSDISNSKLKIGTLDLNDYDNPTSVIFEFDSNNGAYVAIVPEGAEFEAVSYNSDGTVVAKFDQTGQVEFYDYDSAGRLVRIKDQNGCTVKEYRYNNPNNE